MTKRVLVESLWKPRREYDDLVRHPPEGYEFVVHRGFTERTASRLSQHNLAYAAHWTLLKLFPIQLARPYLQRRRGLPRGTDLIYSVVRMEFRKAPWLLDMRLEQPHLLVGSEAIFERWKGLIRRPMVSSRCRMILSELEAGRKAFLQRLPWPELEKKARIVHSAVAKREFVKPEPDGAPVKLLYVNSANITARKHFDTHGGRLLLEAFVQLQKRYEGLQLVVRSAVPEDVKRQYARVPNLRIIDDVIPWAELEHEFRTADIFVYPTHVTPSIVFLDAMSFELPIVTTDVWGNPELVQDGRTGVLVSHPEEDRFTEGFVVHFDSPEYKRAIESVNAELVGNVVRGVRHLIEDPELRRRMGQAGRREVEEGRFSVSKRNAALKAALDVALALPGDVR